MQFQSDILNIKLIRPKFIETTALGAALLAGLTVGFWTNEDITENRTSTDNFLPKISEEESSASYEKWKNAVNQVRTT